ncbi:MAG: DUF1501 domain-containing protein [Candidatus Rokubacteria bacterium]|nr:DUF1501 domain-containing protein [Candidatus Rokubacteria bacterium]
MEITRRALIKSGAVTVLGLGAMPRFLVRAASAGTGSAKGKILVALFQRGAVDGLSMVVPHAEANYYAVRPSIAIPRPQAGSAEAAIDLNGFFGLHPALRPVFPLWESRRLAIVHACGSPDTTRSHFDAQDYMESGTPGVKSTQDGWLNRALKAKPDPSSTAFRAVAMGSALPRALRGEAPSLALSNIADFDIRSGNGTLNAKRGFEALYERGVRDLLHGTGRETFEAVKMLKAADPLRYQPANGAEYPRGRFGDSLRQIAQLIKADIGLEIAFLDSGGWDTHAVQGNSQGQLANRLRELAEGLAAFDRDLGDRMADVVVLTMSEFGRTVQENGIRGTDHGHATVMLALGGPVKGGKVYGKWPGISRQQLFEGRDLEVTTDFRNLFAEVAVRHLAVPAAGLLFPGFPIRPSAFPGTI